jgi:hypothetical protein
MKILSIKSTFLVCISAIIFAIATAWRRLTRIEAAVDLTLAVLYSLSFFPFTRAELSYCWQRTKRFASELFAIFSIILFILVWALVLFTLAGCAAKRRPRVYNDTCDLCITVPHQAPPKPAPPRPRPIHRQVR